MDPPCCRYNAQCDFGELKKGAEGNKNLEVTADALFLFGNGDGGGGPTEPMLEKVRFALASLQTSSSLPR